MTITTSGPYFSTATDVRNLADLIVDAGEYASRNDIGGLWPLFIRLAEAKLNDEMRVGDMMATVIVAMVDGVGVLPDDFLEAYEYTAPDEMEFRDFAVVGNELQLAVPWTGDVTLLYYAKIPGLTYANPTNWLLMKDYNIYLYALVAEICIWAKDFETAKLAAEQKSTRIQALMTNDERYRFGKARVQNMELTP